MYYLTIIVENMLLNSKSIHMGKGCHMKPTVLCCLAMVLVLSSVSCSNNDTPEGFTPIFDGKTLNGWRKFTEYNGDDGKWQVENGAITGVQWPLGKGAYLVTDKSYSDYEIIAEMKADYPTDTGLFLRTQPNILSYQVTIDYRPGGELGAIYCPGGGAFLKHNTEGEKLWKKEGWNTVRARIEGQPAHITVWINGTQTMDFTDTMVDGKYRVPESGLICLQVHPGENNPKGDKVYFKNIYIKEL